MPVLSLGVERDYIGFFDQAHLRAASSSASSATASAICFPRRYTFVMITRFSFGTRVAEVPWALTAGESGTTVTLPFRSVLISGPASPVIQEPEPDTIPPAARSGIGLS